MTPLAWAFRCRLAKLLEMYYLWWLVTISCRRQYIASFTGRGSMPANNPGSTAVSKRSAEQERAGGMFQMPPVGRRAYGAPVLRHCACRDASAWQTRGVVEAWPEGVPQKAVGVVLVPVAGGSRTLSLMLRRTPGATVR